jgi:enamine deaminase RidA (YjgF/YER057c/UK114 family)
MPVITPSNPDGVAPPGTRYSHAVLVQGATRRLVISGQVGKAADDSVPADGAAQIAQAFANLRTILAAHGMAAANVVKTTVFLTDRALLAPYRAARDAFFAAHPAASTLLFVAGLADPRFVVEIEAEAAD